MNDGLSKDYTLKEVAAALGMSERWVRRQIKEGAAHQRYGHKIAFTPAQVALLRSQFTEPTVVESITTGSKKSA